MFFDPGCIPCILNTAYNTTKLYPEIDKQKQLEIIREISARVTDIDENYSAPRFAAVMQLIIEEYLQTDNPYEGIKRKNREIAERYLPYIETMIEASNDRLEMSIRAAILGNIIDFAANPDFDIETAVNRITAGNIDLENYKLFKEDISRAKNILYIGDNYEEALFDKFLIRQMQDKSITFATRSKPVMNDITFSDAMDLGMDEHCDLIESGSRVAGTDLEQCSDLFLDKFEKADLVIAKGQGNFETLLAVSRPIYFLFKVKCNVIAKRAGIPKGIGALYFNKLK